MWGALWAVALLLSGCAGEAPAAGGSTGRLSGAAPERALLMAFRYESSDLFPKIPESIASGERPLFNAALTGLDHGRLPQPFLAEALPRLDTDTWRVFPDGQMETTYRLRQGLTWHDGQPLTAEDFVFAWRAYVEPGLGVFGPVPQILMEEVVAPDPLRVVIRWHSPYADADILAENFPPLPRHILGEPFSAYRQDSGTRDSFLALPFWTTEYVGLGPYRLERWEPGVALHSVAFSGYVFGRPKIDRIVARIFTDENTVLTNVLSGEVEHTTIYTLRFEHAQVLKGEWEATKRGFLLFDPGTAVHSLVQFRPEYQKTPALFDLRVRKALNHAIDREALRDGLFEGQGTIPHTAVRPDEPYFPEVDRAITKYPYDPRRTETLMNEAGLVKGAQGFFVTSGGERFRPDFQVLAGTHFERAGAIMQETWERAGILTEYSVLPTARSRDPFSRHTFSGIGGSVGANYTAEQIGTAENRWSGSNRGGWSSPDYEALWAAFNTTLDRPQRDRLQVEMAKLTSEQLPAFSLYFNLLVNAHTAALRGPRMPNPWWSLHEWELR